MLRGQERNALEILLRNRNLGRMLATLGRGPMTAQELAGSQGISISLCYRYINILARHGIIERIVMGRTDDGRDIIGFRSNLGPADVYEKSCVVKCTISVEKIEADIEF